LGGVLKGADRIENTPGEQAPEKKEAKSNEESKEIVERSFETDFFFEKYVKKDEDDQS
jgi:hypothetical protein